LPCSGQSNPLPSPVMASSSVSAPQIGQWFMFPMSYFISLAREANPIHRAAKTASMRERCRQVKGPRALAGRAAGPKFAPYDLC
jgi:hypothetical protein